MNDDQTPSSELEPSTADESITDPVQAGATPAGWYPDPQMPGQQRYWDGSAWAPSAAPVPSMQPLSTTLMDANERRALLAKQIQFAAAQGGRVESQSDFQAVIVKGQKVNHVLHAILTVVTCLWGIVWIALAASGGETREMIVVDEYGNVQVQHLGKV